MTDIVKRLLDGTACDRVQDQKEAAEEIKRLRAELEEKRSPIVFSVSEMQAGGNISYWVTMTYTGTGRSLTPNYYKLRNRAEYDVACYQALVEGRDPSDVNILDYPDPGD